MNRIYATSSALGAVNFAFSRLSPMTSAIHRTTWARAFSSDQLKQLSSEGSIGTQLGERLPKIIARTGVCGRREAEKRIMEQRVTVNGRIVTDVLHRVLPSDEVWIDEIRVTANKVFSRPLMWGVLKQPGEIIADTDPKKRPLLFDRVPPRRLVEEAGELKPVLRLEYNTAGLLLFTNNGRLARLLESAELGLKRVYKVKIHGLITESKIDGLRRGLTIDGVKYSSMDCSVLRKSGTLNWVRITCSYTKSQQLKRCLENLHLRAVKVYFESLGPFSEKGVSAVEYTPLKIPAAIEKMFYRGLNKGGATKSTVISTIESGSSGDASALNAASIVDSDMEDDETEVENAESTIDGLDEDFKMGDVSPKVKIGLTKEATLKRALQAKITEIAKGQRASTGNTN